jgi:hypothetical protein
VHEELESLEENNTWEIVPKPIGKKVTDSKWVFTLKHVDVKYNFVRNCYMSKKSIDVQYVPTTHQIADILTKGLSYENFNRFRSVIKMVTGY